MNKKIGYLVLVTLILAGYQNCSMSSSHETMSLLASKSCDSVLRDTYRDTYYDLFRANCTSCHDSGGEAGSGRWFATANLGESFLSFQSIGRAKVEGMAVNPGHKPPKTGSQHQAAISAAQSMWTAAEEAVLECNQAANILTIGKSPPSTVYTVATPPNDGATWPRLSFDLNSELANSDLNGKIRLTVSLEVRRARMPGTQNSIGYDFKNPRVTVTGAAPLPSYRIHGLKILLNDNLRSEITFWDTLDYIAYLGTEQIMRAGGYATLNMNGAQNPNDKIALRFDSILDANGLPIGSPSPGPSPTPTPLPTSVTYADLVSANPQLGVFNRRCLSCHQGAGSAAGLDLSSYAQSSAAALLIQSRVNNPANPMPPNNFMSVDERAIIDIWVGGGAAP